MGDPTQLSPEGDADAGASASEACRLERTRISGGVESVVGATGAQLFELADANYFTGLTWVNARSTRLYVKLSNIEIYSVDARRNTGYTRWSEAPPCLSHVRIEGALDISTDDGRLAEHVDSVSLIAYDDYEAHGSFAIERGALFGAYSGVARSDQCLVRLKVRLLIARDGTHGTLGDELQNGPCVEGVASPVNEFASGRWGERSNNYGD